jgi:catechol 2,3-dioxygenase-like lactoylglutathione lyase family enzyme
MAIRIRGVGHVVLKVRDLERAARFYRDVLGLREVALALGGLTMPTGVALAISAWVYQRERLVAG